MAKSIPDVVRVLVPGLKDKTNAEVLQFLSTHLEEKEVQIIYGWINALNESGSAAGEDIKMSKEKLSRKERETLIRKQKALETGDDTWLKGNKPLPKELKEPLIGGKATSRAIKARAEADEMAKLAKPVVAKILQAASKIEPSTAAESAAATVTPKSPEKATGKMEGEGWVASPATKEAPKTPTSKPMASEPSATGWTTGKPKKMSLSQFRKVIEQFRDLGLPLNAADLGEIEITSLSKDGQKKVIEALLKQVASEAPPPTAAAPTSAATSTPAPPRGLDELKNQPLPRDKTTITALLKEMGLSGAKAEARTLNSVNKAVGLGNLGEGQNVGEVLEGVAKGKLKGKPVEGQGFLKNAMGFVGGKSPSYEAEKKVLEAAKAMGPEAAAKAGLGKFVGTGAALKTLMREAGVTKGLLPLALLALTVKSFTDRKSESAKVKAEIAGGEGFQLAEEMRRRLDMERDIMQRRVQMEQNPQLSQDVMKVLSGQNVDRGLTGTEIQIGNITRGRKPVETEQLLSILLGRLSSKGGQLPYEALGESMTGE